MILSFDIFPPVVELFYDKTIFVNLLAENMLFKKS